MFEKYKKIPGVWKSTGILPIILLIFILFGIITIGESPVFSNRQTRASLFAIPSIDQEMTTRGGVTLQASVESKSTQKVAATRETSFLVPADTVLFLEDRQFSCQEVHDRPVLHHWDCVQQGTDKEVEVGIFTKSLETVYLIDVNVRQKAYPDESYTRNAFNSIAEMPGLNINWEDVQAWMEQAVPAVWKKEGMQTLDTGGIRFRMYGSSGDCSLELEFPE